MKYIGLACFLVTVNSITNSYGQTDLLKDSKNLEPVNVKIEEVKYHDKNAIRVTGVSGLNPLAEVIALIKGLEFKNGTIGLEVAGKTLASADSAARGFIGLAFRVNKKDTIAYECFYLRPTNGRAEDQLRRNHAVQYVAHPQFPWFRLRKEFPGVYESYADMVTGEWTKVKIVVRNQDARLYVNGASQPCLVIKKMLQPVSSGQIALWIGPGTDGYFRNLTVKQE